MRRVPGTGVRPVTEIAADETWSALRWRPASCPSGPGANYSAGR